MRDTRAEQQQHDGVRPTARSRRDGLKMPHFLQTFFLFYVVVNIDIDIDVYADICADKIDVDIDIDIDADIDTDIDAYIDIDIDADIDTDIDVDIDIDADIDVHVRGNRKGPLIQRRKPKGHSPTTVQVAVVRTAVVHERSDYCIYLRLLSVLLF